MDVFRESLFEGRNVFLEEFFQIFYGEEISYFENLRRILLIFFCFYGYYQINDQ